MPACQQLCYGHDNVTIRCSILLAMMSLCAMDVVVQEEQVATVYHSLRYRLYYPYTVKSHYNGTRVHQSNRSMVKQALY
jgi:hypothetical protein